MDSNETEGYEFDAPQFVDFVNGGAEQVDPEADKWFDEKDGYDGGILIPVETTSTHTLKQMVEVDNSDLPTRPPNEQPHRLATEVKPKVEEPQPAVETKVQTPNKTIPKNVVTSWSDWKKKTQSSNGVHVKTEETKTITKSQAKKKREQKEPTRKSPRLRTMSTCSTVSNASSNSGCPGKKVPKIKQNLTLTVPSTPSFMRRAAIAKNPVNQAQKTREETQLEIMSKMQKETVSRIKQNQASMKKALAGQSYVPCRSAGENLTRPQQFHFATDDRLGPSSHHTSTENKGNDFFTSLRQHPPSPTFKNRKPTVPVPFKISESRKRKEPDSDNNPCGEYQSMAQKVYQFQKKTPERFRVKSHQEQCQGPLPCAEKNPQKLTNPKTPNLRTGDRKRPLSQDCISKEEQEKIQENEIKSFKFKATELNPRIFQLQGTLGIHVVQPKPLTETEPFEFTTDKRAQTHKPKDETLNKETKEPAQVKAKPAPDFSMVFKPELNHKSTQPAPFSFEDRDKETKVKKEEKIASILEEEKKTHAFQAQPLPSFTPPPLPSSSKLLTEPAPFNLSTENRGALKAEKWSQRLQEEIAEERMKRVFKAKSTNVLYKDPFLPDKAFTKPSTKFEEFYMNTDKRAKEREEYEAQKIERELEEEEARRQMEKEREEEEKIYIRNLRKRLVHKPNPIRKYRPVQIKQSDKELTDPQSPAWQTKKRRRLRV